MSGETILLGLVLSTLAFMVGWVIGAILETIYLWWRHG